MINFNPIEGRDMVLKKKSYIPEMIEAAEGVKSYVYRDYEKDRINEFYEFDSIPHLVDTVEMLHDKEDLKNKMNDDHSRYHYEGEDEWTYGTEFRNRIQTKEALLECKVSEKMWKTIDFLRDSLLADEDIKRLMEKAPSIKRHRKFGLSGDELDIDRVLSGDPQHWQYTTRGKQSNVIRIGLNIAVSSGNEEGVFLQMAAIASVASDLAYKAGAAVEFIMVAFSRNTYRQADNPYVTSKGNKIGEMSKSFSGALATIKKAEEPFSIERVASLGIPGLFRHYIFCLKHAFGSTHPTFGLGNSTQTPSDIYKICYLKNLRVFL